jgi:hypothetical protein
MNLDDAKTSTALWYSCTYFQVHTCNFIAFCSLLAFLVNDPVLVFNAKGGEIKAKANGSANHLRILKIVELEFDLVKILKLQNLVSRGGEFFIMEKGGVFGT